MGLIKNINLDSGLTVANAYCRIESLSGNKNTITLWLNYFVSKPDFVESGTALKQEYVSFVPSVTDDAPNFIKQGYEYLKSIPEFANAIDVLE